jgi:2-methylisocitrate lyase-like PEP mutase family enzyme
MDRNPKVEAFRALHAGPRAFLIGNAWDAGSARILASLGYPAIATSSGASAGTFGRRDGRVTRDECLVQARAICEAVDLPVSADLEKGFGDSPKDAAETIQLAVEVGLAGGSIEDATGNKDKPLYDFDFAVERIAASAAISKKLNFVLMARSENFLRGNPDLDDTIKRLQAYERAGAEVLMAPGIPDLASVKRICSSLTKPFNFMAGIKGKSFTVAELEAAGVRRISLATSLYRAAMTGLIDAAREAKEQGTFGFLERTIATPDFNKFMRD